MGLAAVLMTRPSVTTRQKPLRKILFIHWKLFVYTNVSVPYVGNLFAGAIKLHVHVKRLLGVVIDMRVLFSASHINTLSSIRCKAFQNPRNPLYSCVGQRRPPLLGWKLLNT